MTFDCRRKGFFWYKGIVHSAYQLQFPSGHMRNVVAVN